MPNPLRSVWLNELTWEDVAAYLQSESVVLFPIGSTENHGPHAPLGLDTLVAASLCEDAARRSGVVCTPPLWFGDSTHHMAFPGTLSLRTETLAAVVADVCRSLAHHGFRRIVLVNGHKGTNLPAISTTVRNLHEYELPRVMFVVVDPLQIGRSAARAAKQTTEHHAGELETAEILYKYPQLIRRERFADPGVDWSALGGPFATPDLFGGGHDAVDIPWSSAEQRRITPTGVFSDPSRATPEMGRVYHEGMVDNLVRLIAWLRTYAGPVGAGD